MIEEKVQVQEEKGGAEIVPVTLDAATLALITTLQEKVTSLESKGEASLLAQLIDQVGNRGDSSVEEGQFKFNKAYQMSDIDDSDILPKEEWVTFVAHKVYHFIADDKRAGKNVQAPFEMIRFGYDSTRAIKGGRETELIQMCTYTCKSRIELKWLYKHTTYGVIFFDKIEGTEYSRDFEKSKELSKQMTALQSIGHQDLVTMARQRGLSPGNMDLGSLRASIAIDVVDELFENKGSHTQNTMIEQHLEAKKMGRDGVV